MSPEITSIVALVLLFIIGTALPVNLGALAFLAAFVLAIWLGVPTDDVIAGFPSDLFLILVGITYMFGVAETNGTVDLVINWAVRLERAWEVVRRNRGAAGIDQTTLVGIERYGVDRPLGELARELRAHGWRPLAARRIWIPKPGTAEQRPLSIPAVRGGVIMHGSTGGRWKRSPGQRASALPNRGRPTPSSNNPAHSPALRLRLPPRLHKPS